MGGYDPDLGAFESSPIFIQKFEQEHWMLHGCPMTSILAKPLQTPELVKEASDNDSPKRSFDKAQRATC